MKTGTFGFVFIFSLVFLIYFQDIRKDCTIWPSGNMAGFSRNKIAAIHFGTGIYNRFTGKIHNKTFGSPGFGSLDR